VALTADGRTAASVGYDASVRVWPLDGARQPVVARLPAPLSGVAIAPDGEIVATGSDGRIHVVGEDGEIRRVIDAQPGPLTAVALSRDGDLVAAAGIQGDVTLILRATGRVVRRLGERGTPAWSVAFTPDGRQVLAGGGDGVIRRWNVADGAAVASAEPAPAQDTPAGASPDIAADERGVRVFRACVACHSLTRDGGNRAGPTLHGVFGRRIATVPGYNYSEALRRMEIIWTPETVSRLFEVGPNTYTPGTKMPEQVIGNAEDRAALIRYLERVAAPR
jgi:cytochrome c